MDNEILEDAGKQFRELLWYPWKNEVKFSKGYKEYEETYEFFKNILEQQGFERIEKDDGGYILVTIKKKEKENGKKLF